MDTALKLLLLACLALCAPAQMLRVLPVTASVQTAYTYSRQLQIDRTKCGVSSGLTDFPVLVSITATTAFKLAPASGGHIQHTATQSSPAIVIPADLVFTSDAAGTSLLPWEVELYDGTNGHLVAWVKLPTVNGSDAGSNTTFYMFYGATAVTTAQNTGSFAPSNVWDSGFKGVWHLSTGLDLSDSTSNGNTATNHGASGNTGQVDGAGSFDGLAGYVQVADASSLHFTSDMTLELWINAANYTGTAARNYLKKNGTFIFRKGDVGEPYGQALAIDWWDGTNLKYLSFTLPSTSAWHHLVAVVASNAISALYVDGVSVATGQTQYTTATRDVTQAMTFGGTVGGGSEYFSGILDEVRASAVVRPATWVATEYANQNAPGNIGANNFIIFGSEVTN